MDIKEYKCPNCGGTVRFDSASQKMKCPSCDSEFEIQEEKDTSNWIEEEDLTSGSCPSCGAELVGDANTVAMVCPCCGNAQIVSKRLSGFLKPNYVIPFKLEKDSAVKALKNFCNGKKLLPDFFVKENHINNIQGVYAPFWLFDAEASGDILFEATKVKETGKHEKTNFYSVERKGNIAFEKIPVDGSEKMDDKYMDAIEPFNYVDLKEFNTSYLAGYVAEKYDVDEKKSRERAEHRIKSSVEREFEYSIEEDYDSIEIESSSVNINNFKSSYALFPVWILNTKYKEENYLFMMNGQSGRLVGKLPIDSKKVWKYGFIYSGILGAIFTAIVLSNFFCQWNFALLAVAWVLALIMGFAFVSTWKSQMNTALLKCEADAYIVKDSLVFKKKKDNFLYSEARKL